MAKLSKKQFKELKEKLTRETSGVWEKAGKDERREIMALGERYKAFLDAAKTERLAIRYLIQKAEAAGFQPLLPEAEGRRLFFTWRNKVAALVVRGSRPVAAGLRIIGAHVDAPRLDLKQNPLYEDQGLAFLKTHYYGGIKKYQWLARPLALAGVVCLTDGRTVELRIGDEPQDPVFTILDLLPHLSRKLQESKKLSDVFEAERMNILIGGLPLDTEEKGDKVKLAVLEILNEKFGITEGDLVSAELQAVPAGPARDVGLDRALVGGYGQDDRACTFAAMEAVLDLNDPEMTALVFLVDKEEVGSDGATGAKSRLLEFLVADLLEMEGSPAGALPVARVLANSQAISADTTGAFDPDYPEVHEKLNAAYLGRGVALTKYTGSGGKYGANDADAEYMAWIRGVWDAAEVPWQAAGLGKVDQGGGGTIAKFLAERGMETVDAGPALLSIHAPFEIGHKADIYACRKAFSAFLAATARE